MTRVPTPVAARRHGRSLGRRALALGLACAATLACAAAPAAAKTFSRPALVTSVGQASDIVVVKALLNTQLKMDLAVKPVAQPADLAGIKTLILVVGASAKGLGAAGLDMAKELARTRELVEAAHQQKVPILVLHTGGESRRGKTSNDLIDAVVPQADHVVVVASGNKDKRFDTLAATRKTPVTEVEKLAAAGEAVKALFEE
jgi:hypothetical protein